jgi:hypothetical protein
MSPSSGASELSCCTGLNPVCGSFQKKSGELEGLDRDPLILELRREMFEFVEGLRSKRDEPPLRPGWVGCPPSSRWRSEPGLYFGGNLHSSEVSTSGWDRAPSACP